MSEIKNPSSDTPVATRGDFLIHLRKRWKGTDITVQQMILHHFGEMERELAQRSAYAAGLRDLLIKQIITLGNAGYHGTADPLEDALDRLDAMVGVGPYARTESGRARPDCHSGHEYCATCTFNGGSQPCRIPAVPGEHRADIEK